SCLLRFALLPAFKRYELGKSHRIPRPMTQPLLPSKSLQPLFLVLVLVLVLVLGLLVRKAIEDDDEDEHDKEAAGFFLIVLVVVVVLGLPGEESNRGRRRGEHETAACRNRFDR
ncbi:MAG TPA: hypothetical protein VK775_12635, partial [Chthoniobacterales bacterium]|nr:hypothetical protein [Chthoniobacterales bacterium]